MEKMEREKINWGTGGFLITYQILLLLSLPFYFYYSTPSLSLVVISVVLFYLTGLSITGGYHRLYSHRTYKTNPFIEFLILFFGAMALQGSAIRWCFDHRLHHAHVDTDNDPYSISKGFWYAHFLWLLEVPRKIDEKVVSDLMKNKLVAFQHRHAYWLMVVTNVSVFLFIGWLLNDYLGAFVIATWLRIFALHHSTWFINSLAHTWGDKPFSQEQSAVNNYIISFLTFGEGYHNYHHTYANDYRNGVRWYHFDPTKWLIWTLSKLGFADNLKTMDAYTIKKRMVIENKNLLLEKVCKLWYLKKEELEQLIQETSDRIVNKISEASQLMDEYRLICQECKEKATIDELKNELYQIHASLKQDWKSWVKLTRYINRLKPLER